MAQKLRGPVATAIADGTNTAQLGGKSAIETKSGVESEQVMITGRMPKNARDVVRVALDELNDNRYLDIRVFVPREGGGERPTKAGVTVKLTAIPELIAPIQDAHAVACAQGLLS